MTSNLVNDLYDSAETDLDSQSEVAIAEGNIVDQLTEQLQTWLVQWVADTYGLNVDSLDPQKSLTHYGLDSVTGVSLVSEVEGWLGLKLPPTLIWDCPSIKAFAQNLAERYCQANQ